MRKKRLLTWLAIGAAAAAAVTLAPPEPSEAPEVVAASPARADNPPVSGRLAGLPEREEIGKRRGEIFAARSFAPPPPVKPEPAPAAAAAPPVPPPMPYRVAGRVSRGGKTEVVLARGDAVLPVHVGDTLDGGYRVEAIEPDRVTLLYVPLDTRHSLPVVSTLGPHAAPSVAEAKAELTAPAQAAQLRWEGPREVRAGSPFDVVLRVTSAQPLRASPLQLVFDAKLLEAVEVRPGGFFAGGMFSYRVNPAGSIFVGAAGKGAVAVDAELLIVTFRPIQPGASAELKLSTVMLQSAAGRAIALDRPAAFRTAIVQ